MFTEPIFRGYNYFVLKGKDMRLKGKVAIVTGGGRGIGRAIALGYATEGADLVLAARTKSEIEAVASEIRSLGRQAIPIVSDVSMESDVNSMVERAHAHYGRIDVLVNNAGIIDKDLKEIKDLDLVKWNEIIGINLTGAFLCSRAVIRKMIGQNSGSIINISSGLGKRGRAGYNAYSVSKAGVDRLTEILAEECRKYNIAVNSLEPGGAMKTRMIERTNSSDAPRGEILSPERMVSPAIFLAMQDSKSLTSAFIVAKEWNEKHPEF